MKKFRIITRRDLKSGKAAAQIVHAARQFQEEHPETERQWFKNSNYVAILTAKDENELNRLIEKAQILDVKYSKFEEPDLDYSLTAIALEPGNGAKRICSKLKLFESLTQ